MARKDQWYRKLVSATEDPIALSRLLGGAEEIPSQFLTEAGKKDSKASRDKEAELVGIMMSQGISVD